MSQAPTAPRPSYRPVTCTIWVADPTNMSPTLVSGLTPTEQQRRSRLVQAADKDRFTAGAVLLRHLVAHATGIAPYAVRVDRRCGRCDGPHGKPTVVGQQVEVSVSHSERVVAVALTSSSPVGIDVEWMQSRDTTDLARVSLTPDEPLSDTRDFYRYWCRKEAVTKATGDGLQISPREVVVSPAREPARLYSYQGRSLDCIMVDVDLASGYAGAVAVLARGELVPVVRHVELTELESEHSVAGPTTGP